VVEIPDIAYRDDKTYGAVDMVAANITAAKFVIGKGRPPANLDLNSLEATLSREGRLLASGKGRESLDEQWGSLLTVVNLAIGNGFHIKSGYIVLTGKIGDKPIAETGSYAADFGALDSVRFDIKPCR
jgi:2-keto-4-pentenoate hydratase